MFPQDNHDNDGSDDLPPVDQKVRPAADEKPNIATAREIIDAANDPTGDE